MKKVLRFFTKKKLSLFESILISAAIVFLDNMLLIFASSVLIVVLQIILENLLEETK